jgi:hypothetical protein
MELAAAGVFIVVGTAARARSNSLQPELLQLYDELLKRASA